MLRMILPKLFYSMTYLNLFLFASGLLMLTLSSTDALAQTDDESGRTFYRYDEPEPDPFRESWKDRVVYGGSVLPGYFNGWILDLTPFVGYRLTNSTVAGVGANYFYRSLRNPYLRDRSIWNMYGGRAFVMQEVAFDLFAQVEYDYNYLVYKEKNAFGDETYRFSGSSPGFLVGGGYLQRSGRVGYMLTVLYDVLYDGNSVSRPDPLVIRGGVIIGL